MATDKKQHILDSYKKRLKEGKEEYEKRKEYYASTDTQKILDKYADKIGGQERDGYEDDEEDEEEVEEDTGGAVEEPDGGIGNFIGDGELIVPAEHKKYRFTSVYGQRWGRSHNGIDLAPVTRGDTNTKILSAGDGVVLQAKSGVSGFENWIVIKHKDDLYTIYGHMPFNSIKVKAGQQVKKGEWIALMGKEGQSTGVHLHFEICTSFENRKSTFVDPEKYVNVRESAYAVQVPKARTFAMAVEETEEDELGEPMHDDYSTAGMEVSLSAEERLIDNSFRSHYPYNPVSFSGNALKNSSANRTDFLLKRVGWARTTGYSQFLKLNEQKFIHTGKYDGYEGNLYSPDAKKLFENLLLKMKKPYFEVVSGFRFSQNKQLSPHEAGCAMDILVKNLDEAREIADCAWTLGIRSIAIGGDINNGKGFIHLDICPKENGYSYDGMPIYGGPGKWVIK